METVGPVPSRYTLTMAKISPGGAAMAIPLTEEQQRAIDSAVAMPLQVVDPRTRASYVLVPIEDYEAVREALLDEKQQKAIRAVALRNAAGRIREVPYREGPKP